MHVCYIFLRDILIFILDGTNGSLPEYARALATDTALSEDVMPLLVLGGIFLVMPIISGALITLVHLFMVRTPQWVQITAGTLTVLAAWALFITGVFEDSNLDGLDFVYDGAQAPLIVAAIYLAIFLGIDTVLGWSLKHAIHQLASLPPMIAKVLPVLMVSVLFIFVNADLWKLANGLSFPRTWAVLGLMGLLAVFRGLHDLPRTHSAPAGALQGGDDIASFSETDYEQVVTREGGIWNTAQDWVEEKKILERRPLKIAAWGNLVIIPMIGQIIQATLFMLLVFGFFMGFASIAISDFTIESWMAVKPEHLKILGVDTNINAVVIKVSMIVAVFSGLSFVATTSSDEKYARSFLKPMIERIKHILIIRDIYLGLLTMPKNEVLVPLSEDKTAEKELDKA